MTNTYNVKKKSFFFCLYELNIQPSSRCSSFWRQFPNQKLKNAWSFLGNSTIVFFFLFNSKRCFYFLMFANTQRRAFVQKLPKTSITSISFNFKHLPHFGCSRVTRFIHRNHFSIPGHLLLRRYRVYREKGAPYFWCFAETPRSRVPPNREWPAKQRGRPLWFRKAKRETKNRK